MSTLYLEDETNDRSEVSRKQRDWKRSIKHGKIQIAKSVMVQYTIIMKRVKSVTDDRTAAEPMYSFSE